MANIPPGVFQGPFTPMPTQPGGKPGGGSGGGSGGGGGGKPTAFNWEFDPNTRFPDQPKGSYQGSLYNPIGPPYNRLGEKGLWDGPKRQWKSDRPFSSPMVGEPTGMHNPIRTLEASREDRLWREGIDRFDRLMEEMRREQRLGAGYQPKYGNIDLVNDYWGRDYVPAAQPEKNIF